MGVRNCYSLDKVFKTVIILTKCTDCVNSIRLDFLIADNVALL